MLSRYNDQLDTNLTIHLKKDYFAAMQLNPAVFFSFLKQAPISCPISILCKNIPSNFYSSFLTLALYLYLSSSPALKL